MKLRNMLMKMFGLPVCTRCFMHMKVASSGKKPCCKHCNYLDRFDYMGIDAIVKGSSNVL